VIYFLKEILQPSKPLTPHQTKSGLLQQVQGLVLEKRWAIVTSL
jgi:hypothetical protein